MNKNFQLIAALCLVSFGPLAQAKKKAPMLEMRQTIYNFKIVYGTFPQVNQYFKNPEKMYWLITLDLHHRGFGYLYDATGENVKVSCISESRFLRADREGTPGGETTVLGFDLRLDVWCNSIEAKKSKATQAQIQKAAEEAIRDNIKKLNERGVETPNWESKRPTFGGGVTGSN